MKVKQSETVSLLKALGVDTADRWTPKKLAAELANGGVVRYTPDPLPALDEGQKNLLMSLQTHAGEVDVDADGPPPPRPKKKRPKAPKKTAAGADQAPYPKGFAEWPESKKLKYWRKNPRPLPTAGLAHVVYEQLVNAGRGRHPAPVTKKVLLGVLKVEFKGRDVVKMANNLNNLVPGRFRDVYGVAVEKKKLDGGEWGYWVPPAARKE